MTSITVVCAAYTLAHFLEHSTLFIVAIDVMSALRHRPDGLSGGAGMIVVDFKPRPLWPSLARERELKILKNVALAAMRKRRPVIEVRADVRDAARLMDPPPRAEELRDTITAALTEGRREDRK